MKKEKSRVIPNEHWEIKYSPNSPSEAEKITQGANFNAYSGTHRPTTHVKVNKEDH